MRRILGMTWLLVALLAGQGLAQARPRLAEVVTGVSVNQVMDFLLKNEVAVSKITNADKSTYLSVKFGDWNKLFIDFFDCEREICGSLLLSAGFTLKKSISLEIINTFNYEYRFARAYLDEDGDPWVESDLNLEGGIVLDGLMIWLEDFAATVTDFADAIGYEQ